MHKIRPPLPFNGSAWVMPREVMFPMLSGSRLTRSTPRNREKITRLRGEKGSVRVGEGRAVQQESNEFGLARLLGAESIL